MEDPLEPPATDPGSGSGVPLHYRAQLLPGAEITDRGLAYRDGGELGLVEWGRVHRAFAAEVGEPEGVRTIVFDLVIAVEGKECVAVRFDADPGATARGVARAIELGVGSERCDPSLRALVAEGLASSMHPDLEPFEEACLESVRRRPL